jgi:hypothetical protein
MIADVQAGNDGRLAAARTVVVDGAAAAAGTAIADGAAQCARTLQTARRRRSGSTKV